MRQELHWLDESSSKARLAEEEERRTADANLHAQLRALGEAQERLAAEHGSTTRGAAASLSDTQNTLLQRLTALDERMSGVEHAARSDAESIRSELSQAAAQRETEVAEMAEALAASQQKISDELRWVDEEHMRCRSEDENKVSAAMALMRQEIEASLAELKGQVAEAIVPPGEPGALSTLRQALTRIDVLGEAVGQLCDYMGSLRIKEVASAAEARLSELEQRLAPSTHAGQLEGRVTQLELALAQEQQSSLKALQAILQNAQVSEHQQ